MVVSCIRFLLAVYVIGLTVEMEPVSPSLSVLDLQNEGM